jgi:hypothetical protein
MQVRVRVQAQVGRHPTPEGIPKRCHRPNGTLKDRLRERAAKSHRNARDLTDGRERNRSQLRHLVHDQLRADLVVHRLQIGSHHRSCNLGKLCREEDRTSLARRNGEHLGVSVQELSQALVTVHTRGANREPKSFHYGARRRRRRPNDFVSGIS